MLAICGAKVFTMTGPRLDGRTLLDDGTVLVAHGKIAAVGAGRSMVPADCPVLEAPGWVITPGLIDAHTHLGLSEEGAGQYGDDANEDSEPVTPQLRAIDGLNPCDPGLRDALAGGVTTVMVAPGSANPVGGQCVIIKTPQRPAVDEMVLCRDGGLKIALGENPKGSYGKKGKMPATRMATAALIRGLLAEGVKALRDGQPPVDQDLRLAPVARVLQRVMPLRAHAHRADDIVTALRLAREFHVDIIIEHATEAHLIAPALAAQQVKVVLGPLLSGREKVELQHQSWQAPAALDRCGVPFALMSDHPETPSAFLAVYAGLTTRYGLDPYRALYAITAGAADIMGLNGRVGRLAPGSDADLVVWSGPPLSTAARPLRVMVDGRWVWPDAAAGEAHRY